MARNSIAVAAAVLAISGAAFGRSSYPQYAGEVGLVYDSYDYSVEVTGTRLYLSAYQPAVRLDERYPNQLQPMAQRATAFSGSYGELDHGKPLDAGERAFLLSAVDYAGMGGLSATYFNGEFSLLGIEEESWSFGAVLNGFPAIVCEVEYGSYLLTGGGDFSAESWTVGVGSYVQAWYLWWEASAIFSWSNDFEDFTTVQASAILYLSNTIGVGASVARKMPETSDEETWLALGLNISLSEFVLRLNAEREAETGGDTSFAVSVGYRY